MYLEEKDAARTTAIMTEWMNRSGLAFRFAAALLAVDFVRAIRELLASCAPLARPALLLMALRMTHA